MNARRFSVLAPEGTGDVVDCFPAVPFCIGLRPTADCSSSRPTMEVCSANSCGGSGTVPSPAHHGHLPMVPPTDGRTRVERRATAQGQTPDVLPPPWGRPPSGAMVCVTGDDGTVRLRRLGDSCPDWELLRDGGYSRVRAATVGRLSDGAPVIVTDGDDGTVRVSRLADGTRWGTAARPHRPGECGGRRAIAGWRRGHRHRRRRRHRAGLAAGRHDLASRSATPTRTGKCCRSRQPHRDCGRNRHRCPPASTPPTSPAGETITQCPGNHRAALVSAT